MPLLGWRTFAVVLELSALFRRDRSVIARRDRPVLPCRDRSVLPCRNRIGSAFGAHCLRLIGWLAALVMASEAGSGELFSSSISFAAGDFPRSVAVAHLDGDTAPDKPQEFFIEPADIADEVFHVVHQPSSAWSFDVEIRPFGEKW